MKNLLGLLRRDHRPDVEALSAYADARLAPGDLARLEQHLGGCTACTRELEDLTSVRSMLSSMGQVEVPRSFRLRPADVEAPARTLTPAPRAFSRRALAFAPAISMAAVVLLGVVLAADLGTRGDGGNSGKFAASAPGVSESLTTSQDAATDSARADAGDGEARDGANAEAGPTSLSPAASQIDDSYNAGTPPTGDVPAPAADAALSPDADSAKALNATSEGDDGVRTGYLLAEIALATLAIGGIAWIIYARTRSREVAS